MIKDDKAMGTGVHEELLELPWSFHPGRSGKGVMTQCGKVSQLRVSTAFLPFP